MSSHQPGFASSVPWYAGHVGVAGQRVADQDGVVAGRARVAVGLVGDRDRPQRAPLSRRISSSGVAKVNACFGRLRPRPGPGRVGCIRSSRVLIAPSRNEFKAKIERWVRPERGSDTPPSPVEAPAAGKPRNCAGGFGGSERDARREDPAAAAGVHLAFPAARSEPLQNVPLTSQHMSPRPNCAAGHSARRSGGQPRTSQHRAAAAWCWRATPGKTGGVRPPGAPCASPARSCERP